MENAFSNMISKVSEFLDIFDLSFFVSGVVSFSAVYFGLYNLVEDKISIEMLKNPIVIVISSYVLGMIGFALGRWIKRLLKDTISTMVFSINIVFLGVILFSNETDGILGVILQNRLYSVMTIIIWDALYVVWKKTYRLILVHLAQKIQKSSNTGRFGYIKEIIVDIANGFRHDYEKFDISIKTMIKEHGLENREIFKEYLEVKDRLENENSNKKDAMDRVLYKLYVRLWAEIRESDKEESYKIIKRYWVMNAVYDGLLLSSTLWFAVLVEFLVSNEATKLMYITALAMLFIAIFTACLNESRRLEEYQMQDLIASLAVEKKNRISRDAGNQASN